MSTIKIHKDVLLPKLKQYYDNRTKKFQDWQQQKIDKHLKDPSHFLIEFKRPFKIIFRKRTRIEAAIYLDKNDISWSINQLKLGDFYEEYFSLIHACEFSHDGLINIDIKSLNKIIKE